jgi:hypothetical protein
MSNSYIPPGVDPQMWMGFERRIRERRYQALLATIDNAIDSGDRVAALGALEQARELNPLAPELTEALRRVSALAEASSSITAPENAWSRIFGAVAMLLIGVSLLIGIDWMHTAERAAASVPPVAPVAIAPAIAAAVPVPVNVPVATALHEAPLAAAGTTGRAAPSGRGRGAQAKPEQRAARGWGKVFRPTARFLGTTLPKALGIEVVRDEPDRPAPPRSRI